MKPLYAGELDSDQLELLDRIGDVGSASGLEMRGDDYLYLRIPHRNNASGDFETKPVRLVDLFCGVGGLSLGIEEAASSLGQPIETVYAADTDPNATATYQRNFPTANVQTEDLQQVFSMELGAPLCESEEELVQKSGNIDFLVGGPPCQGHSDLNNYSRRNDAKNRLYGIMARAAEVLQPRHILIENVSGARHDKTKIVDRVGAWLEHLGYRVQTRLVHCIRLGIPQKRRRLILIASRCDVEFLPDPDIADESSGRDVEWAIKDLEDEAPTQPLSTPSTPSKDNQARIRFLFQNNLWNLPNEQRPPCHRHKNHTYTSVYGRLRWDEPAQTITSGFYSMCMGRYVHPSRERTLTAHEAARLQFFPDFFDWSDVSSRTSLARLIGNAVPPKLAYVYAREMLKLDSYQQLDCQQ